MGVTRIIHLTINAECTVANLERMFQRLQEVKCNFFAKEAYDYVRLKNNKSLSTPEAASLVFDEFSKSKRAGPVIIVCGKTHFLLSFKVKYPGMTTLVLTLLSFDWQRDFLNGEVEKDFARYVRFLLDVTQDFPIYEIGIKYE